MKKFPVAIQLFSVRDEMAQDFEGTIKKIAELGYDGVEFAGLFGKSGKEVNDICKKYNINPISAHVGYGELINDPEGVVKAYADAGVKYIAIPALGEELRPGGPDYGSFKEGMTMLAGVMKKYGIKLCYHNHDFEFNKLNDEYLIDIMYRDLGPEIVEPEFDTCWVNIAGENPAEYIKKYSGRISVVHLKDFMLFGEKPEQMYELLGVNEGSLKKQARPTFEFRPCGYGAQDFKAIVAASEAAGASWLIVEQDNPSMDKAPIECAEMSVKYIKSIL